MYGIMSKRVHFSQKTETGTQKMPMAFFATDSGNRATGQPGNYTPFLLNHVNNLTETQYTTHNFLISLIKRRPLLETVFIIIQVMIKEQ